MLFLHLKIYDESRIEQTYLYPKHVDPFSLSMSKLVSMYIVIKFKSVLACTCFHIQILLENISIHGCIILIPLIMHSVIFIIKLVLKTAYSAHK